MVPAQRLVLPGDDSAGLWAGRAPAVFRGVGADEAASRLTERIGPRDPGHRPAGKLVRYPDTCLVLYEIINSDEQAHKVGLRFLLDTYIGRNDGVPFLIPGDRAGCDTSRVFKAAAEVPDSILALEQNNLREPGTVARVQLRLGAGTEAPDRVTLGSWPNPVLNFLLPLDAPRSVGGGTLWDVPVLSMQAMTTIRTPLGPLSQGDSAVVMYWSPRVLLPKERRRVGFAYGLGQLSSGEGGGSLALLGDGIATLGKPFAIQAIVDNPTAGQEATLVLPAGATLRSGEATQPVPAVPAGSLRNQAIVTWQVVADRVGVLPVTVRTVGAKQSRSIVVRKAEERDLWER